MAEAGGDSWLIGLPAAFKDISSNVGDQNQTWGNLWADSFVPWDQGIPNPALVDCLTERQNVLGSPVQMLPDGTVKRKKALVPACGGGYDVLLLAGAGYDAYGVDISQGALDICKDRGPKDFPGFAAKYAPPEGPGTYKYIHGDFFKKDDDWRQKVGLESGTRFDLVYDYTFFCAIHPEMRAAWAERQSEILAPDGRLICLEFPLFRSVADGGPPHGLKSSYYLAHLTDPGVKMAYSPEGEVDPEKYSKEAQASTTNPLALERLAHWKCARTHPIGEGTDCMSIWGHKF